MSWSRIVLVLVLPACVSDSLVPCGDTLCPADYLCDAERAICALPNGLSIPTSVSFDSAPCGAATNAILTVRNLGATALAYDTIVSDIGVLAVPSRGTFPPGDTDVHLVATVPLESIPGHVISGSLLIGLTDSVVKRQVTVTPTGAAFEISTNMLSFGESAVATATLKTVSYTNTGNIPVNVSGVLQPTGAFAFSSGSTLHLEPGENRLLGITFTSNTTDSYTSNLVVTADAPLCQQPLDGIPLDGAATTDAILVDSLSLAFPATSCDQPAASLPLMVTSSNALPQDLTFTISGPDASLFASSIGVQTLPGASSVTAQIQRQATGTTSNGIKTATLDITATLGTLVTNKSIALIQTIRAPNLSVPQVCLDVPVLPAHSILDVPVTVVNAGTATAAVTFNTSGLVTVSPSQFQIPAGQEATPIVTFTNTGNFNLLLEGYHVGVVSAPGNCGGEIELVTCGFMQ